MDNKLNIIPIGSGSTGNAIYLEMGEHKFLVDMGIGFRKIRDALQLNQRSIEDIEAIFVTHGHYDHVRSAKAIANHTLCNVYADATAMYPLRDIAAERIACKANETFEPLPDLKVRMFYVPHDYVKTCGYTFSINGRKISLVTDCGKMNEAILEELSGSDVVIIEANHDIEMLRNGPYPLDLQERILSRYGHLSNIDCAAAVEKLYAQGTRNFLLAHISQHNNTPDLAYETVRKVLNDQDIFLYPCPAESAELLSF